MAIVKELLFNDGEGLDFNDLNDAQRFLRAQATDVLLGGLARKNFSGTVPPIDVLFARAAGAYPKVKVGTARTITNQPGSIFQRIPGTLNGDDPTFVSYFVSMDELQTTFADNSSGLDRIDLVQVKLDNLVGDTESRDFEDATTEVITTTTPNKRRNVRLTFSTKQGTPAATPVEPSPDAGYVKWASTLIPNGIGGADLSFGNIYDQRYPIGHMTAVNFGHEAVYNPSSLWAPSADAAIMESTGSAQILGVLITPPSYDARLLFVHVDTDVPSANVSLRRRVFTAGAASVETIIDSAGGVVADDDRPTLFSALPCWGNGFGSYFGYREQSPPAEAVRGHLYVRFVSSASGQQVGAIHSQWAVPL